ncbi:hypothetical protein [Thalassobius sp. Cn5-15]|uniref:hypothetical protein n=1 Tax=Thalassobius sp. Cn5-15 TaxID=2917763 RepID=UPI001EF2B835|nr:hypothetical protein [Thalassobius sp. Cn5-15]MCG7492493.1 hypothetical protein [Thalassobius sp. Cn5-15]
MTWQQFKKMALRLNLVVLICGWLAFWGYGVLVGDIPPLSVVQGLLALSLIAIIAVTVSFFVGCRLYLALNKKFENPNKLSALSRYAIVGVFVSAVAATLGNGDSIIVFWETTLAVVTIGVGFVSLGILLFISPIEIFQNLTHWSREDTQGF